VYLGVGRAGLLGAASVQAWPVALGCRVEQQRAGGVGQDQRVGQLLAVQFAGLRAVEVQDTEADPADLQRQREHRPDPGVYRGRREHRPAGQAIRGGQVGDKGRAAGKGVHAGAFAEGQGQLFHLGGDRVAGVHRFAGADRQRHRDGGVVHASSHQYDGADVLDGDRRAVGVFDDQAPQPYPAIGVHRAVLSGAAGDEFTGGRLRYR
jgi:hypothetical protein